MADTGPGIAAGAGAGAAASMAGKPDLTEAVASAQRGDEEGFRALYQDMQPRLLRYLRAMVGDDAEDVASETWLHVARDLPAFSGDSDGFRGWAATIARHRATDHQRRHRRRPVPSASRIEDLGELAGGDDTAACAIDAVSTDAALALIADLPRDQAEAVLLRVVIGLDAERAGQVLGKRAGAVRTAAYRGLRRLAARLEKAAAGIEPSQHEGPGGSPGIAATGQPGRDASGHETSAVSAPGRREPGRSRAGRAAHSV